MTNPQHPRPSYSFHDKLVAAGFKHIPSKYYDSYLQEGGMNRRNFLRLIGMGSVAAAINPTALLPKPPLKCDFSFMFERMGELIYYVDKLGDSWSVRSQRGSDGGSWPFSSDYGAELNRYYNKLMDKMAANAAQTKEEIRMEVIRDRR